LRVVAEGVEDERTRTMLADAGCGLGQGWYYAHPMRAAELTARLSDRFAYAHREPAPTNS
jgi:EAL domain-containing protein (putative c-di-GMP-specific phosphodiesterase class I)